MDTLQAKGPSHGVSSIPGVGYERSVAMASTEPRISIVIPVYNEEAILHSAVVDLRERLKPLGWSYEIILAENGSKDGTVALAQELSLKYSEVKSISMGEPNYGKAMKQGILLARGELVICATRTFTGERSTSSTRARRTSSSAASCSPAQRMIDRCCDTWRVRRIRVCSR